LRERELEAHRHEHDADDYRGQPPRPRRVLYRPIDPVGGRCEIRRIEDTRANGDSGDGHHGEEYTEEHRDNPVECLHHCTRPGAASCGAETITLAVRARFMPSASCSLSMTV